MPVRHLPPNPNLDHLKHQAKDLIRDHAARAPHSAQLLREFHPRFLHSTDAEIFAAKLALNDVQLAIARQSGFPSWIRLKRHIEKPTLTDRLDLPHHERIEDPVFRRAVDLIDQGDESGLRAHLRQHPRLAHQHVNFEGGNYFRNPTLLEFAAENPIRNRTLPANIVQVAKIVIEAGTEPSALNETLALVCSGSVPRECRMQLPLIDLLCDYGADPNTALGSAVAQGEFQAVDALIRRGATITLPVAAALGRIDDVRRLLLAAASDDRHRALAWASQFDHLEIVQTLLNAGEDPNRFNPIGCHAHSTPLHQAALAGHNRVVRLLVENGARLDQKDVLWRATPAEWAEHEGRTETAVYLREQEKTRNAKE
ncbi:MAG: ankyrin repeat domain-containing protein [Terracidiphilus sp.]|jgi:hypothetical protein